MLDPVKLRPHYARFLRPDRVLLTGHSHQAWPDVAREGQLAAFDDAAEHVDDKWSRAQTQADRVRAAVAEQLGGAADDVALAGNTHELLTRFLSALDLRRRPHLVTTKGEFHSLSRQLRRLGETGVEVTWVEAAPVATLSERVAAAVRPTTAAVMMSTVLFQTSSRVPHVEAAVRAAQAVGAEVMLDAYHHYGAGPMTPMPGCFVVGGGYKYAQWGEGNCWLVVPQDCELRPVYTGWFSEFGELAAAKEPGEVRYGAGGGLRFAGSTYDPTSHYRAARVIDFFEAQGMSPRALRASYARQTERLRLALPDLTLLSPTDSSARGGFLAFHVPRAERVVKGLRARGIYVDARGETLRLGPAPYLTDEELDHACAAVKDVVAVNERDTVNRNRSGAPLGRE